MKNILIIICLISFSSIHGQDTNYVNIKQNKIKTIIVKSYKKDNNKRYNLQNKTIYNFNKIFKLINEFVIEEKDTVLEKYYSYDSLLEINTYYKKQKIRHEIFDSLDNIIEICSFSTNNKKLFCKNISYEYIHDNKRLITKKTLDDDKKIILKENYYYNSDNDILKIEKCDNNDSIINYITYEYKWGLLVFEAYRNIDDSVQKYVEYIYNSRDKIQEITKGYYGVHSAGDLKIGSNIFVVGGKLTHYEKYLFKYENDILSRIKLSRKDESFKYEYEYNFF